MLNGSCLCGSIRYEIDGELGQIIKCHCTKCRKASGSAFATNAIVETANFRFVGDQTTLAEFESMPGVIRVFCRQCGSPLLSRRPATPDIIRVRIGTLDSTIAGKPAVHIFVGSKAEWDDINDELPQYAERPVQ
ncbi:MAG: hypothetical protein JWM78_2068 [Verrucomicrobiaceae bacterium]|nr:hypothetical protein [Verrucomicrobiaceae bacterium]